MAWQFEISTGEEGMVIVRGCSDGCVEFLKWVNDIDKDTKEAVPRLVAYKYYADVSQAFNKIARMRIGSANASSLKELVEAIKQIRLDIKQEMGVL